MLCRAGNALVHSSVFRPKSSQRAAGKKMFYSRSQERVRYFSTKEGATRIFPGFCLTKRKGGWVWFFIARRGWQEFFPGRTFLPGRKEGVKKKAHDRPHTAEGERRLPRKSNSEKSWINFSNIYLFLWSYTLFYVFQEISVHRKMFQRKAVVDCSWRLAFVGSQRWHLGEVSRRVPQSV